VILAPGFGMSTRAFLLDTIDENFTEFLYRNEYDVWLFDYRGSSDLPESQSQFTLDDIALKDYPVAVEYVCRVADGRGVQIMGHCVGSLTLMMALLDGVNGVRSAVCSQFTAHVDQLPLQQFKAAIHLPDMVKRSGLEYLNPYIDAPHYTGLNRMLDGLLRLAPLHEPCDSPVCRRILSMFGEVFRHAPLNDATHRVMHEMFGETNLTTFMHLARIVREHKAVDFAGRDVYLPGVGNLRSTPVSFIQGAENRLFLPSGSERTFQWLRDANPTGDYRYRLLPGYGHLDCFIGRNSRRDVFPVILEELERGDAAAV